MVETSPFSSLSVIIPTYNRDKVLAKALEGYLSQTSPHLIHELIVVDDGSTDWTESVVQELANRAPFPIRYLRQSNQGPAAARNFGIREARSPLLLFTDSDIIPKRDLVEQHVNWHQLNPAATAAVIGYVTWDPEIHATPFMRWYGESTLFGFDALRNKKKASFLFFYTCNVSLKTEFIRSSGYFDEDFKSAAYEDIDFGYRLSKDGMQLFYSPAAVAYHHQFFSFEDACRKKISNAKAMQVFYGKESGQQILKEIQQKRSRSAYKLARTIAAGSAKMLHPMRRLLDSSLPLPRIVYRLLYWDSTERTPY